MFIDINFFSSAYELYQYNGIISSYLTSNQFTTPPASSIHVQLSIMRTDLRLHFQFKTTDLTYDLGYAEYGETSVCLSLPPSTEGALVIFGTGPLTNNTVYYYYNVAFIYEIKLSETDSCPREYIIVYLYFISLFLLISLRDIVCIDSDAENYQSSVTSTTI